MKTNRAAVEHLRARVKSCHAQKKKKTLGIEKSMHPFLKKKCDNVQKIFVKSRERKPRRFPKERIYVSSHLLRSRAHALESFRGHCLRLTRRASRKSQSQARRINPRREKSHRDIPKISRAQPISRESSHISLEIVRVRRRRMAGPGVFLSPLL